MSKQITRLSGFVVAALVLAALAFGTTQAVATPISSTCMDDGINYLGACGAGGGPAVRCGLRGGPNLRQPRV